MPKNVIEAVPSGLCYCNACKQIYNSLPPWMFTELRVDLGNGTQVLVFCPNCLGVLRMEVTTRHEAVLQGKMK